MKPRILPPLLLLLLIPVGRSAAQQSLDSKQAELTVWARLKTMTPSDLQTVIAKAQGGDAEAQCWVGLVYGEGRLVPKDEEGAARWFLKSAEQGYAPAQRFYGLMSARVNPSVGEGWMTRAAEQGDAEAQFWLGVAYDQNWFGTTDVKEAVKWYQKAAEVVIPMPKLNWDKTTKTAKALNRALSSLPNGIERQQSTFQTWVAQAKEGIDWVSSI